MGGRAWGPGTFDMKGGLVLALAAVDALWAVGAGPRKRVVFLWTSDEEIGSETSRRVIESEARRSDAVLELEPALGREGRLKTEREGVGGAEIIVTGRAAHAGIEPEKGVNAVHELALQIARLMKMNDRARGITVQATVVEGGTAATWCRSGRGRRWIYGLRGQRTLGGLRRGCAGCVRFCVGRGWRCGLGGCVRRLSGVLGCGSCLAWRAG